MVRIGLLLHGGGYHSLLFVPLLLLKRNRKNTDTVAKGRLLPSLKEFFQMMLTFLLVVFGWIIFRAESISQAWHYICGIFNRSLFQMPEYFNKITVSMILLMLAVEWWNRDKAFGLQMEKGRIPLLLRYGAYFLLVFIIYFCGGSQETFIYFQF